MDFRIETVDHDTFNVWRTANETGVADGRVQRDPRARDCWEALVKSPTGPVAIKSGESRCGCLIAILAHFIDG